MNITKHDRLHNMRAVRAEAQAKANKEQTAVEVCEDEYVVEVFEPSSEYGT